MLEVRDAVGDKNARFGCEQALRADDMICNPESAGPNWTWVTLFTKYMSGNMRIDSSQYVIKKDSASPVNTTSCTNT